MWLNSGNQERFDKSFSASNKDKQIVCKSSVMKACIEEIKTISKNSSPVLIVGGYGTGRSMMGRKLFNISHSNNEDLLILDCSGMSIDEAESKMFSESDAIFKNSVSNKTIMLKSIEYLSKKLQSQLLHVIQNSKDKRQGNYTFRLIATANEHIYQKIGKGEFREDLFSYLSQNLLVTPLLVERAEDIPGLIDAFLKENGFKGSITPEAIQSLTNHDWKGNVIELKNVCSQIATLHKDKVITPKELPLVSHQEIKVHLFVKYNPKIKLDELVDYYISQSLKHFKSKKESAKALGISVKTIYNKIDNGSIKV